MTITFYFENYFKEGVVQVWNKNPHSRGAFVHRAPNEKYTFLVSFINQKMESNEDI